MPQGLHVLTLSSRVCSASTAAPEVVLVRGEGHGVARRFAGENADVVLRALLVLVAVAIVLVVLYRSAMRVREGSWAIPPTGDGRLYSQKRYETL